MNDKSLKILFISTNIKFEIVDDGADGGSHAGTDSGSHTDADTSIGYFHATFIFNKIICPPKNVFAIKNKCKSFIGRLFNSASYSREMAQTRLLKIYFC